MLTAKEKTRSSRWDVYLFVEMSLRRRYSRNGRLVISVNGKPTTYAKLERLAAKKYLGIPKH